MKIRVLIGGTVLMLVAVSVLGADPMDSDQSIQCDRADLYKGNELSVDIFGAISLGEFTLGNPSGAAVRQNTQFGAGVGVNYFITRHFGLGVDAYAQNTTGVFIDSASANLVLRLPLGHSGFAPYTFGGGGRKFDLGDAWFAQLGAGMEYRFNRHMGAFLDARWVVPSETQYYGVARLGMRFVF
jgi:Outer membrane protein beta-barrel domain